MGILAKATPLPVQVLCHFLPPPPCCTSSIKALESRPLRVPPLSSGRLCSPRFKIQRRSLLKGAASFLVAALLNETETPSQGMEKLPFRADGYHFWGWRGYKIHYVVQGQGRPVVLIHGFGASAFHWRYNIPELAKKFKVYAIDLLGFGWSEKAIIEYSPFLWRDQVGDFLKEIVKEPAIVVGNSLGGFSALTTAAQYPENVSGVAILNSAGQFHNPEEQSNNDKQDAVLNKLINPIKTWIQRVVLLFAFWQAKQPSRVQSVLKKVYSNPTNVDDYLIESITRPTDDPNAAEVYYRLMTQFFLNPTKITLNDVLERLSCPLLMLWGDLDPWVGPAKAEKIKEIYPDSTIVHLQAGHCPHDEVPELFNKELINWALPITSPVPSQV